MTTKPESSQSLEALWGDSEVTPMCQRGTLSISTLLGTGLAWHASFPGRVPASPSILPSGPDLHFHGVLIWRLQERRQAREPRALGREGSPGPYPFFFDTPILCISFLLPSVPQTLEPLRHWRGDLLWSPLRPLGPGQQRQ